MNTASMQCVYTLFSILATCTCEEQVTVLFCNESGYEYCTKEYSINRKIFKISEYLKTGNKHPEGIAEDGSTETRHNGETEPIKMIYSLDTFDTTVELFEENTKYTYIDTTDLFDILSLVEYLVITDRAGEEVLYRNLAQINIGGDYTGEIITGYSAGDEEIPEVRELILCMLEEFMSVCGVDIRVGADRVARICLKGEEYSEYGDKDSVSAVESSIRVLPNAYNKMQGNGWNILAWFIGAMDIETLDVSECILSKEDAAYIFKMKNLTKLNISWCDLKPGSLSGIENLTNLTELHMSKIWKLNEKDVSSIKTLSKLAKLNMSHFYMNPGSLASIIKNLKNLKELDVSKVWNLNNKDVSSIKMLSKLTKLNMSNCYVNPGSLASIIKNLKNLAELDVSGSNSLNEKDMLSIKTLSNLAKLNMNGCNLKPGSLADIIENLKNLTELDVSGNVDLNEKDMSSTKTLSKLTRLDMSNCSLRPGSLSGIENLKNLTELHMSGHLSDKDMSSIKMLSKLTKLNMKYCNLEPGSLAGIENLKNLAELDVSKVWNLNEKDMSSIKTLSNLTKLNMSNCNLKPGNLSDIIENSKDSLTELDVSGSNNFNEKDMSSIETLSNLAKLNMKYCNLEPGSLAGIENLKNLKELYVSGNKNLNDNDRLTINQLQLKNDDVYCDKMSSCILS